MKRVPSRNAMTPDSGRSTPFGGGKLKDRPLAGRKVTAQQHRKSPAGRTASSCQAVPSPAARPFPRCCCSRTAHHSLYSVVTLLDLPRALRLCQPHLAVCLPEVCLAAPGRTGSSHTRLPVSPMPFTGCRKRPSRSRYVRSAPAEPGDNIAQPTRSPLRVRVATTWRRPLPLALTRSIALSHVSKRS